MGYSFKIKSIKSKAKQHFQDKNIFFESAKLRALCALVPHVLRDLRALVPHVPRALRALVPYLPYVPWCLTCLVSLHALVPRALRALVPHVPRALTALVSYVPRALHLLVSHVPRNLRAFCHICLVSNVLSCLTCRGCSCTPRVLCLACSRAGSNSTCSFSSRPSLASGVSSVCISCLLAFSVSCAFVALAI